MVYLALKWSIDPGKAISNESRVVEYYADFLIYSLSIPMYVAVLLFVYFLWEADAKEEEKGPSSYQLCALKRLICGIPCVQILFEFWLYFGKFGPSYSQDFDVRFT